MNVEVQLDPAALVGDRLLTVCQVADVLHVSKRTVWRWAGDGRLPRPLRFSPTCVRWSALSLQDYLAKRRTAAAL